MVAISGKAGGPRASRGFTLMELMIVVAIVAVLAGLVSTAVVRIMRQAAKNRVENQMAQIRAAVMEYRHDFGRWPIPPGGKWKPVQTGGGYWKLKFCSENMGGCQGDNSVVLEMLLDTGKTGEGYTKRDLIDIHGFSGVMSTNEVSDAEEKRTRTSQTYATWGDAWAMSEPDGEGVHKKIPTLVWKDKVYYCRLCGGYYQNNRCTNRGCDYFKERHAFRKLPASDMREVAKPFYIAFEFDNDRAIVQKYPE